ncbi:MAG TPA: polysaccharide biosynthesis tyrosine autokinase [Rhizomicrobium sp.]|nr:polysaccharide biosynthesis tyrosine autokinase [Rhizomicrobium sp.]
MTDKSAPPLNLIERMAQRLEKEAASAAPGANVIGRAMERDTAESDPAPRSSGAQPVTMREPVQAQPAGRREGVSVVGPAAETVRAPAPRAAEPRTTDPRLGGIPPSAKTVRLDFRALRQNGCITPDNMTSAISNEFRGIKRKLLQKVRDPQTRAAVSNLIMVTSSLPGEGKTFSSINLALSLAAERGLQVLLIDADVIRPSVGNMFVAPPAEGLTDLLTGRVGHVSDVLHRCTDIPNLAVIFAGNPSANTPELISSSRMSNLCKELSARYPDRVIVLDTPPVLASAEPAILASYVHHLVMVVAADQTDRHQLRKSLETIASCQSVSLLFNKAPSWNEPEYVAYYGYANSGTPVAPVEP